MLRASIRDWFCMTVLAHWLGHATPAQMYALGSDIVRRAVEIENPVEAGHNLQAEVMVYRQLDDEFVPQEQEQKWGPA